MSTIHDALKKTQKTISNNKPSAPSPKGEATAHQQPHPNPPPSGNQNQAPTTAAQSREQGQRISAGKRKVLFALFLILLLAGFVVLFLNISSTHLLSPNMALSSSNAPQQQTYGLSLQGIMRMPEKTVALINDEIYEVGDTVEKMKLIKIEDTGITLLKAGKVITIKTIP